MAIGGLIPRSRLGAPEAEPEEIPTSERVRWRKR